MRKGGAVYIMTNKNNTTLYIGVTAYLIERIQNHKDKLNPGSFTARYNLCKLVYYEVFHDIRDAIHRETELKGKSRQKKIDLINELNPDWIDLYDTLL